MGGNKRDRFLRADGICRRKHKHVFIHQCAPANRQHRHNSNSVGEAEGKYVAVYLYVGNHLLLLGQTVEGNELIADSRRALKLKHLCRKLHIGAKSFSRKSRVPVKHSLCRFNPLPIFLGSNTARAGSYASSHISVYTGTLPAYILREGSLTGG